VSDGYLYSCTPNIILTHYVLSISLSSAPSLCLKNLQIYFVQYRAKWSLNFMQTLVLTPLLNSNQEKFAEKGTSVSGMACGQVLSSLDSAGSSERNNKRTHSAGPLKDVLPLTFRLMRVQGLPSWTNTSAVTIQDVIQVLLIKHGHFQWKLLE
jgi:hypothetical protein